VSRAISLFIKQSRFQSLLTHRAASAAALVAVLVLAVSAGAPGTSATTELANQTAAAVSGMGFMTVLGCIACLSAFLIGAGTTIAGLALFLSAHPELAILCASTCVAAVS
jgi:hypothetical protein